MIYKIIMGGKNQKEHGLGVENRADLISNPLQANKIDSDDINNNDGRDLCSWMF